MDNQRSRQRSMEAKEDFNISPISQGWFSFTPKVSSQKFCQLNISASNTAKGYIYVANATSWEWQVQVMVGHDLFGSQSVGAHQISKVPCVCVRSCNLFWKHLMPINIKMIKTIDEYFDNQEYCAILKNKCGIIITNQGPVDAKGQSKGKFVKRLTPGAKECWIPSFPPGHDIEFTWDPHKNLPQGNTCSICTGRSMSYHVLSPPADEIDCSLSNAVKLQLNPGI